MKLLENIDFNLYLTGELNFVESLSWFTKMSSDYVDFQLENEKETNESVPFF